MFRKVALAVCLVVMGLNTALASILEDEVTAAFALAADAYVAKDFEKAATIYKELETSGIVSSALYYNLGTCLAKLGKTGEAVAYLERARRFNPRDADIHANLEMVSPRRSWQEPFVLVRPFVTVRDYLSTREWLWGLTIVHCLSMAVGVWLVWQRKGARWRRLVVGLVVPTYATVAGFAAWSYHAHYGTPSVVVIAPETVIYSGPSTAFTRLLTVNEGEVLRAFPYPEPKWKRVVLPTGQPGFVAASDVKEI